MTLSKFYVVWKYVKDFLLFVQICLSRRWMTVLGLGGVPLLVVHRGRRSVNPSGWSRLRESGDHETCYCRWCRGINVTDGSIPDNGPDTVPAGAALSGAAWISAGLSISGGVWVSPRVSASVSWGVSAWAASWVASSAAAVRAASWAAARAASWAAACRACYEGQGWDFPGGLMRCHFYRTSVNTWHAGFGTIKQ